MERGSVVCPHTFLKLLHWLGSANQCWFQEAEEIQTATVPSSSTRVDRVDPRSPGAKSRKRSIPAKRGPDPPKVHLKNQGSFLLRLVFIDIRCLLSELQTLVDIIGFHSLVDADPFTSFPFLCIYLVRQVLFKASGSLSTNTLLRLS